MRWRKVKNFTSKLENSTLKTDNKNLTIPTQTWTQILIICLTISVKHCDFRTQGYLTNWIQRCWTTLCFVLPIANTTAHHRWRIFLNIVNWPIDTTISRSGAIVTGMWNLSVKYYNMHLTLCLRFIFWTQLLYFLFKIDNCLAFDLWMPLSCEDCLKSYCCIDNTTYIRTIILYVLINFIMFIDYKGH